MGLREFFLWQLEHEAATSRAVIQRIPEGQNRWKPHAGAMELGQLASLVASMPGMVSLLVDRPVLNLDEEAGACPRTAPQGTTADWNRLLTMGLQRSRQALDETTEEHLLGMVRFRQDGHVVSEGPRYAMIADAAFTQQAQHRGQLTVYLDTLKAEQSETLVRSTTKATGKFELHTVVEPMHCKRTMFIGHKI
jgi:hypothetical protein